MSAILGRVFQRASQLASVVPQVSAQSRMLLNRLNVPGVPSFGANTLGQTQLGSSLGAPRFDSTKRKRAKMMNKHKYKKLQKRLRNLTAKNVRGKK